MALSAEQRQNASTIISVGKRSGMSKKDITTAIAVALAESNLINVKYGDRDSQGLFQQRPSQGWGSIAQVTNPTYSATKFFDALKGITNRAGMTEWSAGQAVQRSAFADGSNYRAHISTARDIVNQMYDGPDTAGDADTVGDAESDDSGGLSSGLKEISSGFKRLTEPEFWKRTGLIVMGIGVCVALGFGLLKQSKTYNAIGDGIMTAATRGASKVIK